MYSILYKYLINHGITNLIEVDGLVYAPVDELVAYFFGLVLDFFTMAALVCVVGLAATWIIDYFRDHPLCSSGG